MFLILTENGKVVGCGLRWQCQGGEGKGKRVEERRGGEGKLCHAHGSVCLFL